MSNLISQLQTQQGAFNFVEDIIEDIIDGDRLHVQEDYHTITACGTAHCIAGWMYNDVLVAIGTELSEYEYVFEHNSRSYTRYDQESFNDKTVRIEKMLKTYFDEDIFYRYSCLPPTIQEWAFATALLRITNAESSQLFESYLSLEEIKRNFYRLKEIYSIK